MPRTIAAGKETTVREVKDFCHMMYGLDNCEMSITDTDITLFTELDDGQWSDFQQYFLKTQEEREAEDVAAKALADKPITDGLKPGATIANVKLAVAELAKRLGVEVT